jgi:hypothetical protein
MSGINQSARFDNLSSLSPITKDDNLGNTSRIEKWGNADVGAAGI